MFNAKMIMLAGGTSKEIEKLIDVLERDFEVVFLKG